MGPRMKGPGRPRRHARMRDMDAPHPVSLASSGSSPSATNKEKVTCGSSGTEDIDGGIRAQSPEKTQNEPALEDLPRKGSFPAARKGGTLSNKSLPDENCDLRSEGFDGALRDETGESSKSTGVIPPQFPRDQPGPNDARNIQIQPGQVNPLPFTGLMGPFGPVNGAGPLLNAAGLQASSNAPNLQILPNLWNLGNNACMGFMNHVNPMFPNGGAAGNPANWGNTNAPIPPNQGIPAQDPSRTGISPLTGTGPGNMLNGTWMQVPGPYGHPIVAWVPMANHSQGQQQQHVDSEMSEKDRLLDEQNRIRIKIRESRRAEMMRRYMSTDSSSSDRSSSHKRRDMTITANKSPAFEKEGEISKDTSWYAPRKPRGSAAVKNNPSSKPESPNLPSSEANFEANPTPPPAVSPYTNYSVPFPGGLNSNMPMLMNTGIPGSIPNMIQNVPFGQPLPPTTNIPVPDLGRGPKASDADGPRTRPFRPRSGKRLYGKSQPRTYGYGDIIPENIERRTKISHEDEERALDMLSESYLEFKKQRGDVPDGLFPEHLADSAAVLANFNRHAGAGADARLMAHRQIEEEYAKQRREFHDAVDALRMPAFQHPSGEWLCPLCPDGSPTHQHFKMLLRHAANHLDIKPFRCPFCFRKFRRSDTARRHQASCIQLSIAVQQRIYGYSLQGGSYFSNLQGSGEDEGLSSMNLIRENSDRARGTSTREDRERDNDETSEDEMVDADENVSDDPVAKPENLQEGIKDSQGRNENLSRASPSIPPVVMPLRNT